MINQRIQTPYGPGLVVAIIDHHYIKVKLDEPAVIIDQPSPIAIIPPPKEPQPSLPQSYSGLLA